MVSSFFRWMWNRQYINQPIEKRLIVASLIQTNRL